MPSIPPMQQEAIESRILVQAPAREIYRVYADVARWPQWDPDTRESHLDGAFVPGARGRLRPRRGLPVRMLLTQAEQDRSFTVVCPVLGSRLHFEHLLLPGVGGSVEVVHRVQFSGWLAPWLMRTVGRDVRDGLPTTLASLKRYVEHGEGLPR